MRRSLFTLLALVPVLWLSAQKTTPATQKKAPTVQKPAGTASQGRNISITLTPLKNCKVYLGSHYGNGMVLADSAMLDEKSHGVFKGPGKLVGGIYFVVSPQRTIQFELLMDGPQKFSIVGDTSLKENAVITGSAD